MHLDGFGFVAVFVVFLVILVAAGAGARPTGPLSLRRRPVHLDENPSEDFRPDDIPDDSTPSRSDD